ncbi:hypothetical protein SPSIL_008840 [Sporomusa silvacetica DSM 10669]|uniref:DUF7768 domain-containing protein n=1 Tax=Sporomusa silvacetica DSM 10669 TaxID=1123289 RepID=A0ABZ3IGH8_9FIRM|nr:DUF4406 domain-containing protein [Sporomusa silvacetica]OZC13156.1 hypothetical protein SPSIL_56120 [Sporomusa silvacetica DSM 10669]
MKTVYIAHPLRDNIEENVKKVDAICQQLHNQGEVIPFSPIHAFGFVDPKDDQTKVFEYCKVLLSKADELWVHGNWRNSEGCLIEIEFALQQGIPVMYK